MTIIVRMKHIRAAGVCSRGARAFCEQQGWSWDDFLVNGMDPFVLAATGDQMALDAVKAAEEDCEDYSG